VSNFDGFNVSTTNIADVPLEFINWLKVFNRADRRRFITNQHFSVPIPCAFTKELIDNHYENPGMLNPSHVIKFYTSDYKADGDIVK